MTDAEKREKVIFAIENCLTTDSVTECRKTECPFISCRESCLEWLLRSALALLKEQEPRVMTEEEARETLHNEDFVHFIEDVDDEMLVGFRAGQDYLSLSNGDYMNFDDLDEGGDLATEYGKTFRFWTSRPTPEQKRETKWEGENDG